MIFENPKNIRKLVNYPKNQQNYHFYLLKGEYPSRRCGWYTKHSVLFEVTDELSYLLRFIVNASFTQDIYPTALKISKIVSIYKGKGAKNEIKNHMPAAPQSQFERYMNHVIILV